MATALQVLLDSDNPDPALIHLQSQAFSTRVQEHEGDPRSRKRWEVILKLCRIATGVEAADEVAHEVADEPTHEQQAWKITMESREVVQGQLDELKARYTALQAQFQSQAQAQPQLQTQPQPQAQPQPQTQPQAQPQPQPQPQLQPPPLTHHSNTAPCVMFASQQDELLGPEFDALFGAALLGSELLSSLILHADAWGL